MEIINKNFLVYGAGKSGFSAYKFLLEKGANVCLYADKEIDNTDVNKLNSFSEVLKRKFDYVVLSPGVSIIGNKNINKLKKTGALLISELELGYLFCKGKFIAVTGTNGKTTCVTLLNHILSQKYTTFLCGNIGTPITSIANETDEQCIVICEVSSFMLESVSPNFKPDISVVLNITPDHISRHKTFDNYYKTKLEITNYQNNNDYLLIPQELNNIKTNAKKIIINNKKYKSKLIGDFNNLNIAFCDKICEILQVNKNQIKKAIKTFSPVLYRLQNLGKKKGITYINDSKATNPDACVKALISMKKQVILLLGGSDKGNDFKDIFKQKEKIKLAIIYGQTANSLENDAKFCGFEKIKKFESLKQALENLNQFTKRGDIVLFSPACASYDEFENYVKRGEYFSNYFKNI